jgi:hypothetical protein
MVVATIKYVVLLYFFPLARIAVARGLSCERIKGKRVNELAWCAVEGGHGGNNHRYPCRNNRAPANCSRDWH